MSEMVLSFFQMVSGLQSNIYTRKRHALTTFGASSLTMELKPIKARSRLEEAPWTDII
jgi:hypothetical protein